MAGHHENNVFVISDFDDEMESILVPLTNAVSEQSKAKEGRIDLWISSYGGFSHILMHMVELVETAKRSGVTVRTIVPSVAFSAGSMLAVTGTPGERYIARHAEHLVHYGQVGAVNETTPVQVERWKAWKERGFKYTITHYDKYSSIPDLRAHLMDDGFFIDAKRCIQWGLADKFTEKLILEK